MWWFLTCAGITFLLILATGALWFLNYVLVKIPQQQIMLCDTFAIMAVRRAEQQYPLFEEEQKHHVAIENIREIFEESETMMPGDIAIDTAIRSAIYQVWKEQELLGLSRLKAELDEKALQMEDTQKTKITPRIFNTDSLDRILGVL